MSGPPSKGIIDFLNVTKLLIIGCVFLTIGLFMILTYYITDIEYDEIEGTTDIIANKPKMFELGDLEKQDMVYITISADDEMDIIVDTIDNGRKYIDTHNSYDPYDLPQSSYLANKTLERTVKIVIGDRFLSDESYAIAIIIQKTPYTSWSPTSVTFTISYPNHMTQEMCVPIGAIFIIGAVGCAVAHFYLSWRDKRYQPIEPKGRDGAPRSNTAIKEVKKEHIAPDAKRGKGKKKGAKKGSAK